MPTNVNDIINELNPTHGKKIEARAAELIAEEMTLRELRQARKLTQVRIAKVLCITQDSVSRLEKRTDLLLSTLRKTVEAMGGNLSLVAAFPDRAPVALSGLAGTDGISAPKHRKQLRPATKRSAPKSQRPPRKLSPQLSKPPASIPPN